MSLHWRIYDLSDKTERLGQDEGDPSLDLAERVLTKGTEANFAIVTGSHSPMFPDAPLSIVHNGLIFDCLLGLRDALQEGRQNCMDDGLPDDVTLLEHFKLWLTEPQDAGLSPLAGLAVDFIEHYHNG